VNAGVGVGNEGRWECLVDVGHLDGKVNEEDREGDEN